MINFVELHDKEGSIFVNRKDIVYFYENDRNCSGPERTCISLSNGNALTVNETMKEIKEIVQWQ